MVQIWETWIEVMDLRCRMVPQGLFQGGIDQLFGQAAPKRPFAKGPGKQIHQHGQVAPHRGRPYAGDVATTPNLIGAAGGEPFEQVGVGGQTLVRVGSGRIALGPDQELFLLHDALDALRVDGYPSSAYFMRHEVEAIDGTYQSDVLDETPQIRIIGTLLAPGIGTDRAIQPATQPTNGIIRSQHVDQLPFLLQ